MPARIGPDLWVQVKAGASESDCVDALEREVYDVLSNLSGEKPMAATETAAPRELVTAPAAPHRLRSGLAVARNVRLRPPPRLTLSEWSDQNRHLSDAASAKPGRWVTGRAEYLREIMDACTDRRVEEVVLQKSAQIGGAEVLLNLCGFHMDLEPAPTRRHSRHNRPNPKSPVDSWNWECLGWRCECD